jgi:DNA-binding IclR family transcriptional regulator
MGVRAVNRALEVLAALCETDGGISLRDLSAKVGLHKSTTYRLLQSLISYQFAVQDSETRNYKAGLRVFELAHQVISKMELRTQALPELKELSRRLNETVHLAILDNSDIVYIDKQETQRTVRMYSAVGKRGPAHCTGVGKVLLAHLPQEEIDRIIKKGLRRYTKKTITSPSELKKHLETVRKRGYAVDDTEHEKEIRCVACPIRDHRGKVIAAISLTVPTSRMSRKEIEGLAPLVREYADRISRKMGWVKNEANHQGN